MYEIVKPIPILLNLGTILALRIINARITIPVCLDKQIFSA